MHVVLQEVNCSAINWTFLLYFSTLFSVILRWTDGSVVDYANWWDGEPNNHDKSEQCAFMFTRTNGKCKGCDSIFIINNISAVIRVYVHHTGLR